MVLENDHLRLALDPEHGASVLGLRVRGVPIMPETELAAASFVMAPYSNRIAEGRFAFAGRSWQLENGANHAIHGDVRKRPWDVVVAIETAATFRFHSTPDTNWPWPFACELNYQLAGSTLTTHLTLTNLADAPFPAGCGFHPYFLRREGVELQFAVEGVYPDANGTRIPSGPAEPFEEYRALKALDPTRFHDFCATGWDGHAVLVWRDLRVELRASEALRHLVVYNPPKPYFAIEPVSNANDGVNLFDRGDPTSGVRVLGPGEAMHAAFELRVVG